MPNGFYIPCYSRWLKTSQMTVASSIAGAVCLPSIIHVNLHSQYAESWQTKPSLLNFCTLFQLSALSHHALTLSGNLFTCLVICFAKYLSYISPVCMIALGSGGVWRGMHPMISLYLHPVQEWSMLPCRSREVFPVPLGAIIARILDMQKLWVRFPASAAVHVKGCLFYQIESMLHVCCRRAAWMCSLDSMSSVSGVPQGAMVRR